MFREIGAAGRLIARQKKTRKDGGWKCETEGEEKVVESEERENGNQAEKYLAFYLPLIKFITLSVSETGRGIDRDIRGKERERERRRGRNSY